MAAQRYSDEQMLEALRAAASVTGQPMSTGAYTGVQRGGDLPTWTAIKHRFGSWNAACRQAGLEVTVQSGRPPTWTTDDVRRVVAEFLADPEVSSSAITAYEAWARPRPDAPSSQTVRNTFGSWSAAKESAGDAARDA